MTDKDINHSYTAHIFALRGYGNYGVDDPPCNTDLAKTAVQEYLCYYFVQCYRNDHIGRQELTNYLQYLEYMNEAIMRTLYEWLK